MSHPSEEQLRQLFAADAADAPKVSGLTEGALRRVRDYRRSHSAWALAVVGVAAMVAVLVGTGQGRPADSLPAAAPTQPTSEASSPAGEPEAVPSRQGPVPFGGAESCVQTYSPAAVADRAFAFDGTVTSIGPARSNRHTADGTLVGVTFRVNKWFRGGSGDTVTVDWYAPGQLNSATDPSLASYGIGTRLLVSGEPRWGGAALDAAIAWSCGFTRYYAPQTAAEWASAIR